MRKELQSKLFTRFPDLFEYHGPCDPDSPGYRHPMQFGIECSDGWFKLIWELCEKIEGLDSGCRAVQVKEKFGGLRFYTNGTTTYVHEAIEDAERKSLQTCEWCGEVGTNKGSKGWIRTLCRKCRAKEREGWRPWAEKEGT